MSFGFIGKSPLAPLCQRGAQDYSPFGKGGWSGIFQRLFSCSFVSQWLMSIPASKARRESFRKDRKDSGQAGMTDKNNEFMEIFLCRQLVSWNNDMTMFSR